MPGNVLRDLFVAYFHYELNIKKLIHFTSLLRILLSFTSPHI